MKNVNQTNIQLYIKDKEMSNFLSKTTVQSMLLNEQSLNTVKLASKMHELTLEFPKEHHNPEDRLFNIFALHKLHSMQIFA